MPNWCTNTLIVAGDKWNVKDFMDQIKTKEGSESSEEYEILENLYPTPEDLDIRATFEPDPEKDPQREQKQANIEKYGHADWYEWRNANWGTKWGDCNTQLVDEDYDSTFVESFGKVMLNFDSAWGPPHEGMVYIASIFPRLMFDLRYYEPGMCFQGFLVLHHGEIEYDQSMEYMEDSHARWEWIDEDFDTKLSDWTEIANG